MPATATPIESAAEPVEETPERVSGPGSTLRTTGKLLRFAMGVDSGRFLVTIGVTLASSVAEGAVLVILLPLLAAAGISFPGGTLPGRLAAWSQGVLARSGLPHSLWLPVVLGVFLCFGAARSVLRRVQSTLMYVTTDAVELSLSRRVYAAVVRAEWVYLVRQRAGRLTHILTEQLYRVTEAIALLFSLINLLCLTVLYLLLALKLSVAMTALVLGMGAVLLLLQRRALRRSRMAGKALSESIGEVFAATGEHLLNLKSVKTYDAEDRDLEHFSALCARVVERSIASAKNQAAAAFRFELGSLLALAGIIFFALGVLHIAAATMLVLLGIFTRLMPQLATLQSQAHQFAAALPGYELVLELETECIAHAEPRAADAAVTAPLLRHAIAVENLWFAYTDRGAVENAEYVLRGASFEIRAGTLTAITGTSGAGKSTLADILNGLLTPSRGRVLVDRTELTKPGLRDWRRHVAYVGQETVLFHQSIRENLLWARPDASEAELREALELAAAEFVDSLPTGLDTVAGDRGVLLSSGQRQRIALARALLRRPSLLILDEATNALDVENEQRILDALLRAIAARQGSLTVLMIAHRTTALERADNVIVMDGGRVAERK